LEDKVKKLEEQVSSLVSIIEDMREEGKLMSNSVSGRAVFRVNQDK
jgi:hypothetical protein